MGSTDTATSSSSSSQIPTIDFSRWNSSSSANQRLAVAKELTDACHEVGFVCITNHGIDPSLLETAFNWSRKLFDLKHEQKMLAPHPDGPAVHRGYSWPGLEKVSQVISPDGAEGVGEKLREVVDCKESYEIGSEENEEQPNVWLPEDILPGFREFMMSFYWACNTTANSILEALGAGMGLKDPGFLSKFHQGHNNQLRLLHYPPILAAKLESKKSARMEAHSDWGSITLLFQDDCGGLEVENRDVAGQFLKVEPVQNGLLMNVGDLLMRWSNDCLKSTLHRVTLPPAADRFTGAEMMTRARYSIPYFVAPDPDAVVECLEECAGVGKPVKYEPVVQREYSRLRSKLQY